MKANFTLTRASKNEFIRRFKRMLSVTGIVEQYSIYSGAKSGANILNKAGVKHCIENIVRTVSSYIDKDTLRIENYGDVQQPGIMLHVNDDCTIVIYYGQKMRITSNRIYFTNYISDAIDRMTKRRASLDVFKVCGDVENAKRENHWRNLQSKIYWDMVADEYDFS